MSPPSAVSAARRSTARSSRSCPTVTLGYNFTNPYLIYPLTRYNAYARGTYELSDNISVFGQALFAKSSSDTIQQPSPVVTGWSVLVNPAIDRAVIPTSLLNILRDSRPNPNAPFQLVGNIPGYRTEHNDVYNYNLVAGLQGKIPSIDWTYEVFGSRGESETTAFQGGIASLQRLPGGRRPSRTSAQGLHPATSRAL